jgi:CheY-like chemotaxis protein
MAQILVVDDDVQTRKTLRLVLESAGHEVVEAPNGKVAMSLYKETPVHLVIADMIMPQAGGAETIASLRKDDPDVKIIAISGGSHIGSDSYLRVAEKLGALHTLTKPFGKRELLQAVQAVLG